MKFTVKILSICLVLFLCSCESLLEIEPKQSVDPSKTLTAEGMQASLTNLYAYLKTTVLYGRDFVASAEALADNARIINRAGGRYQPQGTNTVNNHLNNWEFAYAAINEANLLLKNLPIADLTPTLRDEIEGQAKALRALFYFDLVRAYAYEPNMAPPDADRGGVPLMLSGVVLQSDIERKPRAAQSEIYAQIYADLTDALTKAPDAGGPAYITKGAVRALFAKVALYNQDWANAEAYATAALTAPNVPGLIDNANYVNGWRTSVHPESIFEVTFTNANESIGVNESVQSAFTTRSSLLVDRLAGYGAVVPTDAFLALFVKVTVPTPNVDVRRALYQPGVARSNVIATECTKFLGKSGTIYMDNIPLIRVSEVYLIRAEARAKQGGKDTEALSDLNAIAVREGRGATPYAALTGSALVDQIIAQRRLELAFEGDRWFDLKRRGANVVKASGNVPYTDFRILPGIPVREIQSNNLLLQNLGY
ncbi:RagB/SusD family nutrient uptake outer membrane protein [Fulvivirgaceae bacterium PWU4]|uniref:RagB/SusD family nutrient uptake outer membrane protein n=1 Tax=Chryseosolibacter histidini TaxID=2782349 RepID=A0AAP2DQU2_9BACT|nr:RagB/SusD family nutrient uptake outer membrane protein [Chryseosolibacter histidini]MBT1698639.1 RagB/SusD family nutrient uptake outer membrane protein [Chryseosolibacter histidini]